MNRRKKKKHPTPQHTPHTQHTRTIPGGQRVCIDRITCPHCKRSGVAYAFARFHFNNCELYGLTQSLKEVEND